MKALAGRSSVRLFGVLLAVLPLPVRVWGSDWPQWGGPGRDFKVEAERLADAWPEGGPRLLWERPLGEGYSAISAVDGVLFTLYRQGETEIVIAMRAGDGSTVWEHRYPAPMTDPPYELQEGPGPHATPLVAGGRVFATGATGILSALDQATGNLVWSHDLIAEYGGNMRVRGYSCSPLAYRDMVILMVGGPGRAVMAFDQKDGSVVWESMDARNSHSSPLLIEVEGQPQLVAFLFDEVAGLDPDDGRPLWRHPHPTDYGLNISTPIWGRDGILFVSSAYGGGSRAIRLKRDGAETRTEELWFSRRLRLHFGNAIRIGNTVYGASGDFGATLMTAMDVETGRLLWRDRAVSKGSMLLADGKLIFLTEEGELVLARVTPEKLQVLARATVSQDRAWTVPTLTGKTLYLRNRRVIKAFDLGAR